MKNMINKWTAALALAGCVGTANAGVIDLRDLDGNFNQSSWGGVSGTEHYAQSITADGTVWSEVGFGISTAAGGTFEVLLTGSRAAGLAGTGFAPDASNILYQQSLVHSGGGLEIFDLLINIPTIIDNVYFLELMGFGGTISRATVRATQYRGSDKYAGGEFIYSNDNSGLTNDLRWTSRARVNEDLAFRAVFESTARVPTPATLALFALGLAGLCWSRRKA